MNSPLSPANSVHQISQSRQQIRQLIRQRRQQLSHQQQHQASLQVCQQALQLIQQRKAQHIALYIAFDGELSTQPLIEQLWQQHKKVYLPVLHPFCQGHLLFIAYQPDSQLIKNQFGILEPELNVQNILPTEQLDIIFTPLVAFDKAGNRLGMGGGFYDRTLQNWQQKNFIPVGLAHRCQQVDKLPTESWDIPLADILVA